MYYSVATGTSNVETPKLNLAQKIQDPYLDTIGQTNTSNPCNKS